MAVRARPDREVIADLEATFGNRALLEPVEGEELTHAIHQAFSEAESVLDLVGEFSDGLTGSLTGCSFFT